MPRDVKTMGHAGHPVLFDRLQAKSAELMQTGQQRHAAGVVAAIWIVRAYFREYLDLDLNDPGPPSQFGDLPP
jgi:hypothetical protein